MKKTRQKKLKVSRRNTLVVAPIMKKGGPHQRIDKRAPRARQAARLRRVLSDESGSE
jgi:hypothetical protein